MTKDLYAVVVCREVDVTLHGPFRTDEELQAAVVAQSSDDLNIAIRLEVSRGSSVSIEAVDACWLFDGIDLDEEDE